MRKAEEAEKETKQKREGAVCFEESRFMGGLRRDINLLNTGDLSFSLQARASDHLRRLGIG